MPDASELVKIIKKTSKEAVEAGKPMNILFGKVISEEPLKINVEQKMVLGKAQLILSRNVTEHEIEITVDTSTDKALSDKAFSFLGSTGEAGEPIHMHAFEGSTEKAELEHEHAIKKRMKIMLHNGLVTGDEVILIRQQGGQKYLVVDRIG